MAGPVGPPNNRNFHNDFSDADPPHLNLDVQKKIGEALRELCDDIIGQPIPAKFVELLQKLEQEQPQKRTRS